MTKSNTSQKRIEAGYERFAHDGPNGIQVERLARIIGVNKIWVLSQLGRNQRNTLEGNRSGHD